VGIQNKIIIHTHNHTLRGPSDLEIKKALGATNGERCKYASRKSYSMIELKQIILERLPEITLLSITTFILYWTYTSLAWQTILKKLKSKHSWLAWIPFGRKGLILHETGYNWRQMFFLFLPILGWIYLEVLTRISIYKAFRMRKYAGWPIFLTFITLIPLPTDIPKYIIMSGFLIFLGFVAWKDIPTSRRK
jgi:hypothetical protein